MAEIVAVGGIYRRLVGARIRSQLQYRLSFALNVAGSALISFLDFAAILVIFGRIDALEGWSVAEVAFLYGVSSVTFALTDVAVGQLDQLPRMVRAGEFDLILVRPLGSLFQVISADIPLRHLGRTLQGVAVLAVAIAYADVEWTAARGAMLVLMILAGIVIFASIWVAFSSIVFWIVDSQEVTNAFTYGGGFLSQYPVDVFASWLRRFVTFFVPIAFASYYPSLYVLGKEDPLGLPGAVQFASPLVAVVAVTAGTLVWRVAVRHYRSTGS